MHSCFIGITKLLSKFGNMVDCLEKLSAIYDKNKKSFEMYPLQTTRSTILVLTHKHELILDPKRGLGKKKNFFLPQMF